MGAGLGDRNRVRGRGGKGKRGRGEGEWEEILFGIILDKRADVAIRKAPCLPVHPLLLPLSLPRCRD